MKFTLFIVAILFFCNCAEYQKSQNIMMVKNKKGYNTMHIDIFPEIIDDGCTEAVSLNGTNRFACTRGSIFSFGTLTDDVKLQFETIKDHFAYEGVGDLGADPDGKMLWGKDGDKGLWMIDPETKQTIDTIPFGSELYGSGEYIWRIRSTSLPGKIYYFRYRGASNVEESHRYGLFDFEKRKEIFIPEIPLIDPPVLTCWPLAKSEYLISSFVVIDKDENPIARWYIADLSLNGFVNWRTNKLTDSLTAHDFCAEDYAHHNCVNIQQRIIIGHYHIGKKDFDGVVKWNDKFDDVLVSPLIMQCPSQYSFSQRGWLFSPDGNWLAGVARERNFETNTKEKPQLVFYHIDSKYPLGISPPVFAPGGDTKNGCFVNHSKLGMVYLDFGTGYNLTMLYKMNDLLPIIAEKLKALVK